MWVISNPISTSPARMGGSSSRWYGTMTTHALSRRWWKSSNDRLRFLSIMEGLLRHNHRVRWHQLLILPRESIFWIPIIAIWRKGFTSATSRNGSAFLDSKNTLEPTNSRNGTSRERKWKIRLFHGLGLRQFEFCHCAHQRNCMKAFCFELTFLDKNWDKTYSLRV